MRQYEHEYERVEDGAPPRAISREEGAALTCSACGCRLTARESLRDSGIYGADAAWRHFPGMGDRDARGCLVECMDLAHGTVPRD